MCVIWYILSKNNSKYRINVIFVCTLYRFRYKFRFYSNNTHCTSVQRERLENRTDTQGCNFKWTLDSPNAVIYVCTYIHKYVQVKSVNPLRNRTKIPKDKGELLGYLKWHAIEWLLSAFRRRRDVISTHLVTKYFWKPKTLWHQTQNGAGF